MSVDGADMGGDMALGPVGDFATQPSTLTVSPLSAALAFGQAQPFTANRAVTWSVVEAGGGQIDGNGRYVAPSVAGVFHVHAVATDGSGDEKFATVTVSEHALTFIAGAYGGLGDADGAGTSARFSSTHGMAYDGANYVYVADAGAIRRLDITTNVVTTVAGRARWWTGNVDDVGAKAKFGIPWGVALDGHGSLYVTDYSQDTIRKIDLATSKVTTIAGTAGVAGFSNNNGTAATFSGPMGLAFDSARNALYVADANNAVIRRYDVASTQVSTLANNFGQPDGLVLDGNGMLYVVDVGAHQVVEVDVSAGTRQLVAGSGRGFRDGVGAQAHLDSPSQATLADGALYVTDTLGVRKVDLASQLVTTLPVRRGDARSLSSVISDGHAHLYVSAQDDYAIRRLDLATGDDFIAAGPDGLGSGNVDGVGEVARFSSPGPVAADASGELYVGDSNNGEVRRVDLAATAVSTLVGTAWQVADIDGVGHQASMTPISIASDHAGTLYIVESGDGTIRKWITSTNTVTTIAGRDGFPGVSDGTGSAARFHTPVAACVDGAALYVADQNNFTIRKVTLATGAVVTIAGVGEEAGLLDGAGAAARFAAPVGIACDGAGHVYVADRTGYAIRRIDLSNNNNVDTPVGGLGLPGYADMPGTAARFNSPGEMAFANGFLYVVDNGNVNLHVRKINVATWDVTTIGSSSLGGQQFYGIAVDGSGNVYVSNKTFGGSGIFKVNGDATVTQIAGSSGMNDALVVDGVGAAANFYGAAGMTFDGTALYIAEPTAQVARRMDVSSLMVTTPVGHGAQSPNVAGTGSGAFIAQPMGLALANATTLIVGDSSWIDSVTLPGAVVTVAAGKVGYAGGMDGTGTGATVAPAGLVSDGAGTIYFTGASSVRRFVVATGKVDTLAGTEGTSGSADGQKSAAQFYYPLGITLDNAGNLFVSDTYNDTIRKVVIATGDVTTFAGTAGAFGAVDDIGTNARFFRPMGIVFDGKGGLYVADSENGAIRRIEIATRAVTTYVGVLGEKGLQPGPLPVAHLNTPTGLALLPDGGLAITDEQALLVVH